MTDRRFVLAGVLAVSALVIVAGSPSLRNGFLNYDDPQMIVANERLADPGPRDAVLAFSETREYAYLPIYVLALMPDAAFFGLDPAGFHLGSLLWHAIASAIVLLFAHALTRSRTTALVAAAIFAVHPMAAESVAWASGRKDQVSFVLLLLALSAALGHLRHGGAGRILLSALCAALALLAKGSAVVYPLLVLLLVAYARSDGTLGVRARPRALVAWSVLVAAAGAALHFWIAQREGTSTPGYLDAWERFLVFLESTWGYFRNLVFPGRLSIHYDVLPGHVAREVAGAALLSFCAAAAFALRRAKGRLRAGLFAAAWFGAVLLPFNGVFPETSVSMADRYAFNALPALGIAIGVMLSRLPAWPRIVAVVAIVGVLVPVARARYGEFRDGETVFRAALRVDPRDSLAPLKLGEVLRDKPPASANRAEAITLFRSAADSARDPVREARARLLLADSLLKSGRFAEAVAESDRLLDLERAQGVRLRALGWDASTVRFNRAAALLGAGRRPEAVQGLDDLLREAPGHRQARVLRAGLDAQEALVALVAAPEPDIRDRMRESVNRSIVTYENVIAELSSRPAGDGEAADQEIQATADLSRLLQRAEWRPDRLNEALMRVEALIRRHPDRAEGFLVRAQIMSDVDPESSAADLRAAAARAPGSTVLMRGIASGFLAIGKNREGVTILERARLADPGDPGPVNDLRAIYVAAAKGHLEKEASGPDIKRAREALKLAKALSPDHEDVIALEAETLEREGRQSEAVLVWKRLLAIVPTNAKARLAVARVRQQEGLAILANMKALTESYPAESRSAWRNELLTKVAAEFAAAAELAPDSEETDLARGWLRTEKRRTTLDPLLARARAAAEKGEMNEASRLAEEAAAGDPTYVEAVELTGHLAMQKGEEQKAFSAFEKTVALDAENLAANDALARLHWKRGERDKALDRARKFLAVAARMRDETMTLRQEVEFMQELVLRIEREAAESRGR